jgi:hypothetical protein
MTHYLGGVPIVAWLSLAHLCNCGTLGSSPCVLQQSSFLTNPSRFVHRTCQANTLHSMLFMDRYLRGLLKLWPASIKVIMGLRTGQRRSVPNSWAKQTEFLVDVRHAAQKPYHIGTEALLV